MRSLTSDRIKGPRVIELSTKEKVFSIVKNISGPSKIYLERQNYFRPTKLFSTTFVQYGFPHFVASSCLKATRRLILLFKIDKLMIRFV